MDFLILSKSRTNGIAMWWLPEGKGYTNNVDKAGRFSADESARIVRGSPEKDMRIPWGAINRTISTRRIVDVGDADNHAELMAFDGA